MMTLNQAEKSLKDAQDLESLTQEQSKTVCEALKILADASSYEIFGVCAEAYAEGIEALRSYAGALDYSLSTAMEQQLLPIEGPIYLKFNPRTQRCFADSYSGTYRGVLVSFQSDSETGFSGTYGYFPLRLFAAQA